MRRRFLGPPERWRNVGLTIVAERVHTGRFSSFSFPATLWSRCADRCGDLPAAVRAATDLGAAADSGTELLPMRLTRPADRAANYVDAASRRAARAGSGVEGARRATPSRLARAFSFLTDLRGFARLLLLDALGTPGSSAPRMEGSGSPPRPQPLGISRTSIPRREVVARTLRRPRIPQRIAIRGES